MVPDTVSLCVIAYNEEKNIKSVLSDLYEQTYPREKTQIVLVDGRSKDSTKSIMEEFAAAHRDEYLDITVCTNEKRIQAAGWNVAIGAAKGDVIIRIDAHTKIPKEFAELNMRDHKEGEKISGGQRPCIASNDSPWSDTLLIVENSLFGSSINDSRRRSGKQYVRTLFHAAYDRDVFDEVGVFNEGLLRTEDNELHYRLGQAGYKFYLDPDIISYQYARSDLKGMTKQKYGNGYWIGTTLKICPGCISTYHLVPMAFVFGIVITTILAAFGIWQLSALMWGLYLLFAIVSGVIGARGHKFSPYMLLIPILFLVLHVAYGIGTIAGLVRGKKYVASSDIA